MLLGRNLISEQGITGAVLAARRGTLSGACLRYKGLQSHTQTTSVISVFYFSCVKAIHLKVKAGKA